MQNLNDIRSIFLNYFENNDHKVVPSSPLIPHNDPTLLFTNSGMVQFKSLFTGLETRDYQRAATAQKCVRAGGKHNDLDNVGYTARHHTFFEMLGNFSFGDYFKSDAIAFAWELLTGDLGIDEDRLLVTVFHTDDEAIRIWKSVTGFSDDRILKITTNDNFWMMGPTGPCGPCTEIFFDHGDQYFGGPPGTPDEEGDRYVEIWNLVFMQYEQLEDGTRRDLDAQSIDTGMGIERVAALLQGTNDNYATDLMRNLIEASANVTSSDPDGPHRNHHRVIADHLRSVSFLLADGVMPANEGRGYVLRRIMRRAMRHAHALDAKDPLMYRLVARLVEQMGAAYPELGRAQVLIEETLKQEEIRFRKTLERGLKLLDAELELLAAGEDLPGDIAFKLYDTYGFPVDLTQDALRERERGVDLQGFQSAMTDQKRKARAAWSGLGDSNESKLWFDLADAHGVTEFLGYDMDRAEGQIIALVSDGRLIQSCRKGEAVNVVMSQTPFYAEAGGQVGDCGSITTRAASMQVTNTQKIANIIVHTAVIETGSVMVGESASLQVNRKRRSEIRANHSATHLLHEALRSRLGNHVLQRGSLNADDRLRFDFNHSRALTSDELRDVQAEVNSLIRQNAPVMTRIMSLDDARDMGALALFGEKYGDEVRVVSMGQRENSGKGYNGDIYSIELCGGTHVSRTGDIGAFAIVQDTASSAGVRRIEALTGQTALNWFIEKADAADWFKDRLRAHGIADAKAKQMALLTRLRELQNEVGQLKRDLVVLGSSQSSPAHTKEMNGHKFMTETVSGIAGKELPALMDQYKERIGSGIILLFAPAENKVAVAVGVTHNLTCEYSAVDLVRTAVSEIGGKGGGGRVDFAQGGGPHAENIPMAIAAVVQLLEE